MKAIAFQRRPDSTLAMKLIINQGIEVIACLSIRDSVPQRSPHPHENMRAGGRNFWITDIQE
jgi:hypothetical protein